MTLAREYLILKHFSEISASQKNKKFKLLVRVFIAEPYKIAEVRSQKNHNI